jgi:hypothetical protein
MLSEAMPKDADAMRIHNVQVICKVNMEIIAKVVLQIIRSDTKATPANLKHIILVGLTLQNAVHTLLVRKCVALFCKFTMNQVRYSRSRDVEAMFFSSVAVFWTEVVKLIICIAAVCLESGSVVEYV